MTQAHDWVPPSGYSAAFYGRQPQVVPEKRDEKALAYLKQTAKRLKCVMTEAFLFIVLPE